MSVTTLPTYEDLVSRIMDEICNNCEGMGNKRDRIREDHDLLDDWNLTSGDIGDALEGARSEFGLTVEDLDKEMRDNAKTPRLIAELLLHSLAKKAA